MVALEDCDPICGKGLQRSHEVVACECLCGWRVSSTDFAVFSTPYHLFSTLSNFSLYPLRHFSRPYSTPIGARSLLCRYKHSLGLYKRPLQPAHQPTHPAHPPPGLPNPHPAPPCPQPQQPTLHYQPLHFSIWTHPARPNKKQVWASSLYTL